MTPIGSKRHEQRPADSDGCIGWLLKRTIKTEFEGFERWVDSVNNRTLPSIGQIRHENHSIGTNAAVPLASLCGCTTLALYCALTHLHTHPKYEPRSTTQRLHNMRHRPHHVNIHDHIRHSNRVTSYPYQAAAPVHV